jgi:hypothetical protein
MSRTCSFRHIHVDALLWNHVYLRGRVKIKLAVYDLAICAISTCIIYLFKLKLIHHTKHSTIQTISSKTKGNIISSFQNLDNNFVLQGYSIIFTIRGWKFVFIFYLCFMNDTTILCIISSNWSLYTSVSLKKNCWSISILFHMYVEQWLHYKILFY